MNKKKTVLIVDDDRNSAGTLKVFLDKKGYDVEHVSDGELALRYVEAKTPDIILLDIIMPKMDGFTVAKHLRYDERTKLIPIIVFSAQEGMKDLFAIEGINDYLVKPVNHEELLTLIRKRVG